MFARILAPLAGAALIAAPAIAQSAAPLPAQPAAVERAGGGDGQGSRLEGGSWIAPALAALIVLGGVLLAAGVFDDDDEPVSP